ncbi:unnamed protein product [Phytomonas sp. EM1]|nr:unnamed protein product [Phytomonas sp. EM1]|eukprot:CCW62809.1 unnamed protein product [Phytomonas sp. isolate EM1]
MKVIRSGAHLALREALYWKKIDRRWLCGSAFQIGSQGPEKVQEPAKAASRGGLRVHASPAATFVHSPEQLLGVARPIRSITTPTPVAKGKVSATRHLSSCSAAVSCVCRSLRRAPSRRPFAREKGLSTVPVGEVGMTFTDGGEDRATQPRVRDASTAVGGFLHTPPTQRMGGSASGPSLTSPGTFNDGESASSTWVSREQEQTLSLALAGASLFVGGKAGTGKSFLLREIARVMRLRGIRVAVTASTGIAALNVGGNTFHSVFGVPVYQDDGADGSRCTRCARAPKAYRGQLTYDVKVLSQVDVIFIDEVSLLHGGYLEALERAARGAEGKNPDKPFGGIQIILFGDFMQLTSFWSQQGSLPYRANALASIGKHKDRFVCARVARDNDVAVQYAAIKAALERVHKDSDRKAVGRRFRVGHYSTLPMYESYAFRNFLLHVQLGESARHRVDVDFLRDLNLLRVGILTYRLSRSFILNPEDDGAIRLFATRRSVKAYNRKQMLDLSGREVVFKSHLRLSCVSEGSPADRSHGAEGPRCNRTSRGFWSDVALLHFAPRGVFPRRAVHSCWNFGARRWALDRVCAISDSEAQSIVHEVCQASSLSADRFFAYVLPFAPRYSPGVRSIAVRSFGGSRRQATTQLNVFLSSASDRIQRGAPLRDLAGVSAGNVGSMFGSVPRWVLVRFEPCSTHKLASCLQHRFQHHFRGNIEDDLVTQTKRLKVGCRVMLLRNLNARYVNGSLGTIVDFAPLSTCGHLLPLELKVLLAPNCLFFAPPVGRGKRGDGVALRGGLGDSAKRTMLEGVAEAASMGTTMVQRMPIPSSATAFTGHVELPLVQMDVDGSVVAIPWITLPFPGAPSGVFFSVRVMCMPLTPAYAFTVHKIQGITFDRPVLFDAAGMFPCDHLVYVAASRVRRFSQFRSVNVSPRMVTVHIPSLRFSEHLPDISTTTARWGAWVRSRGLSMNDDTMGSGLFLPNWKDPPQYLC